MAKESVSKKFWNRYAKLYDFEVLRFSGSAFKEMYRLMGKSLDTNMKVLELATGMGLIALGIAPFVNFIEATDFSPKMIETAMKKNAPQNVHFSVEDATALSFANHSFDAVVISNALHIMPDPKTVLTEIKRVLKPDGLLIAPTFTHGHLNKSNWNFSAVILKMVGFETSSKWLPEEYVAFIGENGFNVRNWRVLQAAFPLVYLEASSKGSGQNGYNT